MDQKTKNRYEKITLIRTRFFEASARWKTIFRRQTSWESVLSRKSKFRNANLKQRSGVSVECRKSFKGRRSTETPLRQKGGPWTSEGVGSPHSQVCPDCH